MKQLLRMAFALGALFVSLCAVSGPAGAIGGETPPPIGTSCSFAESMGVGSVISVSVTCNFDPGSTITITLNGAAYGTATAPATGTFVETFAATAGPSVSLNGGPAVATTYGAVNTFVASGTNPGAGTNVATTLVTITPAGVVSSPATATPGTATATASATPVTSSGLAFTGADIAAMVIGGLGLVAIGVVIVISSRRRKAAAP